MFVIGEIWETLYRQFNGKDEDRKDEIRDESRKAYYELCKETSWENLRDSIAYTYNEAHDGMWLPANLIGIDCVTDGVNLWKKTNPPAAASVNSLQKLWFVAEHNKAPLVSGTGLEIENGSNTFTGATGITAAHVGEYIRIGGQAVVYKLASATTLETPYYGDKQTNGSFEVRPIGTKRIKLLSENAETDRTAATIYYWRFPDQLYNDDQLMLLPTARVLELSTSIRINGNDRDTEGKNDAQKDLYGSKGRYEGELSRALSLNPDFQPPVRPENRNGTPAGWGARKI